MDSQLHDSIELFTPTPPRPRMGGGRCSTGASMLNDTIASASMDLSQESVDLFAGLAGRSTMKPRRRLLPGNGDDDKDEGEEERQEENEKEEEEEEEDEDEEEEEGKEQRGGVHSNQEDEQEDKVDAALQGEYNWVYEASQSQLHLSMGSIPVGRDDNNSVMDKEGDHLDEDVAKDADDDDDDDDDRGAEGLSMPLSMPSLPLSMGRWSRTSHPSSMGGSMLLSRELAEQDTSWVVQGAAQEDTADASDGHGSDGNGNGNGNGQDGDGRRPGSTVPDSMPTTLHEKEEEEQHGDDDDGDDDDDDRSNTALKNNAGAFVTPRSHRRSLVSPSAFTDMAPSTSSNTSNRRMTRSTSKRTREQEQEQSTLKKREKEKTRTTTTTTATAAAAAAEAAALAQRTPTVWSVRGAWTASRGRHVSPHPVAALCLEVGLIKTITTKAGRQARLAEVVLEDCQHVRFTLTLWGERVQWALLWHEGDLLVLEGMGLKPYQGAICASTCASTRMRVAGHVYNQQHHQQQAEEEEEEEEEEEAPRKRAHKSASQRQEEPHGDGEDGEEDDMEEEEEEMPPPPASIITAAVARRKETTKQTKQPKQTRAVKAVKAAAVAAPLRKDKDKLGVPLGDALHRLRQSAQRDHPLLCRTPAADQSGRGNTAREATKQVLLRGGQAGVCAGAAGAAAGGGGGAPLGRIPTTSDLSQLVDGRVVHFVGGLYIDRVLDALREAGVLHVHANANQMPMDRMRGRVYRDHLGVLRKHCVVQVHVAPHVTVPLYLLGAAAEVMVAAMQQAQTLDVEARQPHRKANNNKVGQHVHPPRVFVLSLVLARYDHDRALDQYGLYATPYFHVKEVLEGTLKEEVQRLFAPGQHACALSSLTEIASHLQRQHHTGSLVRVPVLARVLWTQSYAALLQHKSTSSNNSARKTDERRATSKAADEEDSGGLLPYVQRVCHECGGCKPAASIPITRDDAICPRCSGEVECEWRYEAVEMMLWAADKDTEEEEGEEEEAYEVYASQMSQMSQMMMASPAAEANARSLSRSLSLSFPNSNSSSKKKKNKKKKTTGKGKEKKSNKGSNNKGSNNQHHHDDHDHHDDDDDDDDAEPGIALRAEAPPSIIEALLLGVPAHSMRTSCSVREREQHAMREAAVALGSVRGVPLGVTLACRAALDDNDVVVSQSFRVVRVDFDV